MTDSNTGMCSEETKEKRRVAEFHRRRVMFIVYGGEILLKMRSILSHEEWWNEMKMPSDVDFFSLPRGYIVDNKIYFYKGKDFHVNSDLVNTARSMAPILIESFNMVNPEVYCGMIEGKKGQPWEPICRVNIDKQIEVESTSEESSIEISIKPDSERTEAEILYEGVVKGLKKQRAVLFALVCRLFSTLSWRSKKSREGVSPEDCFYAGINTPQGGYFMCLDMDMWTVFNGVTTKEKAPTNFKQFPKEENIMRLFSLLNVGRDVISEDPSDNHSGDYV